MRDPMTTYEAAVEEAEARQDEQLDEQRMAEAEGWLRVLWAELREDYDRDEWAARTMLHEVVKVTSPALPKTAMTVPQARLSAAYDVLGLSGTLRALARFVEEEERSRG